MKRSLCVTVFYSIIHFLVDLSGIFFLIGMIMPDVSSAEEWILLVLLYNGTAFALPMPIGLAADYLDRNKLFAAVGCILIFLAYLCEPNIPMVLSVILAGVGNGMFHVGGGIDVLNLSLHKYSFAGIFISTGALGVYLGNMWGKAHILLQRKLMLIILLSGLVLLLFWYRDKRDSDRVYNVVVKMPKKSSKLVLAILSLFLVVCIRSYYGMILNYTWKSAGIMGLAFALCVVLGKMFGGIFADWLGSVVVSLMVAALFAVFSFESPLCGLISILLFNMTMPVTLVAIARIFCYARGFAFGILTFALFLGTLPTIGNSESVFFTPMGLCTLCILSSLLLAVGLKWERECEDI